MATNPPFPPQSPYTANTYPVATPNFPGKVRVLGILFALQAALVLLILLAVAVYIPFLAPVHHNVNTVGPDGQVTSPSTVTAGALNRPAIAGFETILLFAGLLTVALPFATAYGLLKRKSWGRIVCLINSFLIVLSFPFGTALGGYSMYLFFQSGAREAYDQLALTSDTARY